MCAAIEKICEFSGEYPAHLMYGYKKNSIQIMPKYRGQFRNAVCILVYTPVTKYFKLNKYWNEICEFTTNPEYGKIRYTTNPLEPYKWSGPGYYSWKRIYGKECLNKRVKVKREYFYDLYCPDLQEE